MSSPSSAMIATSLSLQGPSKRARRTQSAKGLIAAEADEPPTEVDHADAAIPSEIPHHQQAASAPLSRSGSQAIGDEDVGTKEAVLPLKEDTVIRTKWLDGQFHLARVVSVRTRAGAGDETDKEYYMHYVNMNRRMDAWVTAEVMDLSWHEIDSIDEKRFAPVHAYLMASAATRLTALLTEHALALLCTWIEKRQHTVRIRVMAEVCDAEIEGCASRKWTRQSVCEHSVSFKSP
jgi:hypothetical protein